MAASSAAPSLTDSYTVPDWVERNIQLFRSPPPGVDGRAVRNRSGTPRVAGSSITSAVIFKSKKVKEGADQGAAGGEEEYYYATAMAAMLMNEEEGVGWIEAPAGLQPPSYFSDIANHPNILATLVYSARRRAGLVPGVTGQQLSLEQWEDYFSKFNAWLSHLDDFHFYITLTQQSQQTIPNSTATSVSVEELVNPLADFVLNSTAHEVNADQAKEVKQRIKSTVELAVEYMVEKNISECTTLIPTHVVNAGFKHEALPAPGPSNPTISISFFTTTLTKNKKTSHSSCTVQYGPTTMHNFAFQLNSANIIANAEALAQGSTLLSTKAYVDYINGPLDKWAQSTSNPPYTSN